MLDLLWAASESAECRDDATAVCIQVRSLPQPLVRRDGWPRLLRFKDYGDYQRLKGEVAKILADATDKEHSLCLKSGEAYVFGNCSGIPLNRSKIKLDSSRLICYH